MKKKILIPIFLAAMAMPLAFANNAQELDAYFIGEGNKSAYINYAASINAEICNEGMVLLKNEDNFLPMNGNERLSVFSKNSTNLLKGGGGSGSGRDNGAETPVNLQQSLTNAGFTLNPDLTSFYNNDNQSGGKRSTPTKYDGTGYNTIGETDISKYSAALKQTFAQYNDAAVVVITRAGSEGVDDRTYDARDDDGKPFSHKHYLQLSDNEEDMLEMVEQNFDNIVVLINSGNVVQCDKFENNPKVKAILWIGTPGTSGVSAVGRILKGEVNPSGRTVDTWARDFTEDPTWKNFGSNAQHGLVNDGTSNAKYVPQDTMFNADGTPVKSIGTDADGPKWVDEANLLVEGGLNGVRPSSFVSYEEGVYYDYRYYETYYADLAVSNKAAADEWYDSSKGVIFPFGYGLSYTSFEQEIISCNIAGKTIGKDDGNVKVNVKVKVKNTGDVAGKEVVQLYWKAPYTAGGIEKADHILCAFDKTKMLNPGDEQELTLDFYTQDFANYDFSDANKNNFRGYELDPGEYEISLNKNAHEKWGSVKFNVGGKGIKYPYDMYTNNPVENRFTDAGFYSSLPGEDDIEFEQMSRADLDATFPEEPTLESRTLGENSRVEEFLNHPFNIADLDVEKNFEYIPEAAYKTKEDIEALGWTQAETAPSKEDSIQIETLRGVPLDDPRWDELMDQMTYAEMLNFVTGSGSHNPAIDRMGKKGTGDSDGPSQFQITWWAGAPIVAATYNTELARKQGECVGMEAHINNQYGWAGPAVNIHRSPFGGRNFEYYSADPLISGRMAGRVVAGATDRGIYCFFKHFVANDQETNREGVVVYVTEQALREIYAKAFQYVVQEGKVTGIMSSYNRLGLMETAASYPLLTEVLRNEWGFKGHIISDMTHHQYRSGNFNSECYENINNRLLAGCNQQLDGQSYKDDVNCRWSSEKHCPVFTYVEDAEEYESYSWWYAVRTMCKGCLYSNINSGAYAATLIAEAEGVKLSDVRADKRFEAKIGENVNIDIELPDTLAVGQQYNGKNINAVELAIDEYTPLPDGLSLSDGKISGTPTKEANVFIHVLVKLSLEGQTSETILGTDFEMNILPIANMYDEPEEQPKKKGCGGSIVAASSLTVLIGALAAGLLTIIKRRED